ncbi:MAG: hypothetical protein EU539_01120 [Promethearchaeota archaeon]|nr:MAG: hypothetical protein EU539_01120 [Candidatus Lokiarchaeota archaeon]
MMSEGEFYDHILGQFSQISGDSHQKELWKNNKIRDLMTKFKNNGDPCFVKNALIVIMALFDDYLKDSYFLNSKSIKESSREKKDLILSFLKDIFRR